MRILLTANASYAPPKGGSTRSNLVWLADLASHGHECRVVCPGNTDDSVVADGIDIRRVRDLARRATVLREHMADFQPDWVLVSSEDVAHTLLREAFAAAPDRLVYLAHTPQWYPFGPASWHEDRQATDIVRRARAAVAIAYTTAHYIEQYCGVSAHVIHPPIYGEPPWPRFGSFDSGYVLIVNPSVVKGIRVFLELARRFPDIPFAGLAGWGTTTQDREAMRSLPNVQVLEPVATIDEVLSRARLLLMPSLWYEGFGLIAMEAMLRGVPVIASNAGGLVEAKQGTGYIIPVRAIEKFEPVFDETRMPKPVDVPQDIDPWERALRTLLTDEAEYRREADASRSAAEKFVSGLRASALRELLSGLTRGVTERTLKVLLAHNSLYYPSHGGGDKSNRLLMEALAARGHEVRVVARVERFGPEDHARLLSDLGQRRVEVGTTPEGVVRFPLNGVDVHTVALDTNIRGYFSAQVAGFDPDVIITSTDDPGQLLFELAVRSRRARVVHLVRATIAVPFGPDSSAPNAAKADLLKYADGAVGVSQYVADYVRRWGGIDAIHVPISLLDEGPEPAHVGRFENRYVTIVNPCAVKGIDIFLQLADQMPEVQFAAVPTWGTNPEDSAALLSRPHVTVLPPVDNIDDLLRQTKVLLVPSVWAEARSRIVVEAMSRGVPVISSDAGGLPEAHMGVEYVLPVNQIRNYKHAVDSRMVPVAEVPAQDTEPWQRALGRLVADREHWEDVARRSREAALEYARNLSVLPFERYLREIVGRPKKVPPAPALSEDKRKLLALRLRQKAAIKASDPWFAGAEELQPGRPALLCLPWAGGGTILYRQWAQALAGRSAVVAVRLPGRETRIKEPPFESMEELIPALGNALQPYLDGRPYVLFGHSMGAGIAFELSRWLRERGLPLPQTVIASAARAPQSRLNWTPGPEPTDDELLSQLQRLQGLPADFLSNPSMHALILPVIRADARLYRHYVYNPGPPLDVPILAWGGAEDPNVRPEHLEGWREQTSVEFARREFPGGHFYFQSGQPDFLSVLAEDVAASLERAGVR
jgi:surfactin synthase thioesterase subunit/glycosyltransferase involved in cell wall biosynthesis